MSGQVQACEACPARYDAEAAACPECGAPAPGASEEEVLMTGMWRDLSSLLSQDTDHHSPPKGVRLRRVGSQVEIQQLDPDVVVVINGEQISGTVKIFLAAARVEVGGVQITEDMVPQDALTKDELPEFFSPITIGRNPDADFVIDDPAVSGHHARLSREPGGVQIEDLDSANGVFIDGQRLKRSPVHWRSVFRVGNRNLTALEVYQEVRLARVSANTSVLSALNFDPSQLAGNLAQADKAQFAAMLNPGSGGGGGMAAAIEFEEGVPLVIGRGEDADIVIDSPQVSRHHARMTRVGGGIMVEDLASGNGTWVNGQRIAAPTLCEPSDDVRVGPHKIALTKDLKVQADSGERGVTGVRLDLRKVCRDVGDPKNPIRVVDSVGFTVLPGEMVAIMGPSGAGKTSVLTTLAGYTPPAEGTILIDGLSLYENYDLFRQAVGYVPQEDVMHRILTVEEVLFYQAKISFPPEYTDEDIRARITVVLEQLELSRVRDTIVGDEVRRGLSGGQRKRLNVAMELMSSPSLLVLDEPTSGLDARSAMELIVQCRKLASAGRTVVMTIHQPREEAFQLFDKLLLLTKGGKVAYYGPVQDARAYFSSRSEVPGQSAKNPADYVLEALDPVEEFMAKKPAFWKKEFRQSEEFQRFVGQRQKKDEIKQARDKQSGDVYRADPFRQLYWLTHRYARLKLRDSNALLVQLAQAPVIAALAVLLFYKGRFWPIRLQDDVTPTLFVIVAAAVWFGCSNVAREIVGEAAIFRRESMGTLRAGPYLLSKMIVQGVLIVLQVGILLLILTPVLPLQGSLLGLIGVPMLAGLSAMCLGLFISTIARTEMAAIQYVPLIILPQIMLSGILVPVAGENVTKMASFLSKPILLRWAYGAFLHVEYAVGTVRGDKSRNFGTGGQFWKQVGFGEDTLSGDLLIITGIGLACAVASWILLLRRDRR